MSRIISVCLAYTHFGVTFKFAVVKPSPQTPSWWSGYKLIADLAFLSDLALCTLEGGGFTVMILRREYIPAFKPSKILTTDLEVTFSEKGPRLALCNMSRASEIN